MSIRKKVSIHFYKIVIKSDIHRVTQTDYINLYSKLKTLTKPTHMHEINDYPAYIKHIRDEIYCLEKHRREDLPTIGKIDGPEETNLVLQRNESLIEKNYFQINTSSNYIVYQEKHEGYKASTMAKYLQEIYSNSDYEITIVDIMKQNMYSQLLQFGYLKTVDISLASPSDQVLQNFGISIDDRITFDSNATFDVAFRLQLTQKIQPRRNYVNELISLFQADRGSINTIKVKGSETRNGKNQEVNLAKVVYEHLPEVQTEDGTLNEMSLISCIREAESIYGEEIRNTIRS